MTLNPGTLLNNRYRIVSILGQGGMGAVYEAVDENLKIYVAVKENLFLSEEYTRQFQREASILATMRHPTLPRVGDYFAISGQGQYLIMDYIEGEDLRQRIERMNVLPARDVILIGAQICDALSYLHSRTPPIVHRDIKPGNVKITPEGEVCLVDFGLAKIMMDSQATTTGARAMTPGYSPPEQYGTARTDPRSDIYSLGATLYAALTGVIPEDGLARATNKATLTPIRQFTPSVDRRLAEAIEIALEIEPEHRYQSAEEFKVALLEAGSINPATQRRLLVTPPPEGSTSQPPKPPSRPVNPTPARRKRKARIKPFPIVLTAFVLLLTAFFILRPDVSAAIAARFIPAPLATPTVADPQVTQTQPPLADTPTQGLSPAAGDDPAQTPLPPEEAPTASATLPAPTLAFTPTRTPSPTPTAFGGGLGQIAFVSDRSGTFQLWTMNADGSQQRQLTDMPNGACQPAWAPDGSQLAFISPCAGKRNEIYENAQIYLMNADGKNIRLMPRTQTGDFDPAWSPEGSRIAFTSLRNGVPHIFVLDMSEDTLSEVSDTRHADFQPAWRPGARQLAFVRKMTFNHIWIMSDQGFTQFQYSSSGDVNDTSPVWSSDGEFLLYTRSKISPTIPWIQLLAYENRENGPELRIPPLNTPDIGPVSDPDISPDNLWIIYESWPDGRNHDIFRVDINGADRIRLTSDPGFDFGPTWRPMTALTAP